MTLDELDFKLILDDRKFNQQIQADLKAAKDLNTQLSSLLNVKVQLNAISKQDVENSRRAAMIEKDRVKYLEMANRERMKTQALADRLSRSAGGHTSQLMDHNKLLKDATNMVTKYVSAWGAKELVENIIRVTGEFEMQKRTLAAMLQDAHAAQQIYEQIKGLAVVSPFNFKELMNYSKQLAAFSVPINELYDSTKMLADVSAGLGVGMDRLVLAYGQIRSAAFLRGQEVRQLTEAGIPVLEELRKQFFELGEEGITTADVFDKISKRLVPFSMVEKMFKDMTSEGGKFYQMQEIQAETLQGKISNLTDAYQIMFNEIGEKYGKAIKGSVDAVRSLAENYETVLRVIKDLLWAYGVYKTTLALISVYEKAAAISGGRVNVSMKAMAQAVKILVKESNLYLAVTKMISKINPWAAGIALVGGVITNIVLARKEAREFREELNKIANTEFTKTQKNIDRLKDLFAQLKNTNDGSQRRREIISQLNREYGDYLPKLLSEKNSLQEILAIENQLTNSIRARAKAYAIQESTNKLEDKKGEDLTAALNVLAGRVRAFGLGQEQVSEFLAGFRDAVRNDPNVDATFDLFKQKFDAYFGDGKWAEYGTQANGKGAAVASAFGTYSDLLREYIKEENRIINSINTRFAESTYSTQAERNAINPIVEAYNREAEALRDLDLANEEYQQRLNALNLDKLYKMKAAYEALDNEVDAQGNKINVGTWTDKLKQIQAQIDALEPKDTQWLQKIVNPLVTGKGNNDLKAQETTKYKDYLDDLRKAYKSVSEEYKDAGNTYNKLTADKKAGLTVDDAVLAKAKEQYEQLESRKEIIEAIGKALGVTIDDKIKKAQGKTPEQKDIEAQIDLVKKLQNAYEGLSDYIDEKDMPRTLAQLFSAAGVDEEMTKNLDFRDQLIELAERLRKFDTEAADKLLNYLGYDESSEAIRALKELAKARKQALDAEERYRDFVNSWIPGSDLEGEKAAFNISKIVHDYIVEVGKLQNKSNEALDKLTEAANARMKQNALEGKMGIKDASSEAVEAARSVVNVWAKASGLNLSDLSSMTEGELDALANKLKNADFSDFWESILLGANESMLAMDDFKNVMFAVLAEIVDKIEKTKIGNKLAQSTANALARAKEGIRKEAERFVKNDWADEHGFELSNFSQQSIAELFRIKNAIESFDVSDLPDDIKKSLEEAGESVDEFAEEAGEAMEAIGKKVSREITEKIIAGMDKIGSAVSGVFGEVKSYAEEIGNNGLASQMEYLGDAIESVSSAISSAAKGDYLGALMSMLMMIVNNGVKSTIVLDRWRRQIEDIRKEQAKLNQELRLSAGVSSLWGGNEYRGFINAISELKSQSEGARQKISDLLDEIVRFKRLDDDDYVNDEDKWFQGLLSGRIQDADFNLIRGREFYDRHIETNFLRQLRFYADKLNAPLYREDGLFNIETLESILKLLSSYPGTGFKHDIENIKELIEQTELYDNALEAFESSFESIFGQVTDSIVDNVVEAFKKAGDVALDYKDIMDDVATSIVKSLMKSQLLETIFDSDKARETAEKVLHGDVAGAMQIIEGAMAQVEGVFPYWQALLEAMRPYFNMGGESGSGMTNSIQSLTENTGDLLASYINAIRADISYGKIQRDNMLNYLDRISAQIPSLTDYLNQIAANTFDSAQIQQEMMSTIKSLLTAEGGNLAMRVYM